MKKERIAMTGDSLNFNLGRILQTMEPDLSGIVITHSGEVIRDITQELINAVSAYSSSEPVSAKQGTVHNEE
jgi:hypothetical protein